MLKLEFSTKSYEPEHFTGGTIFLMAAYGTKAWYYKPVVQVLLGYGFKVHVYDYLSRPLLSAHPEQWVEFNKRINIDVAARLKAEKKLHPKARFGIIGASVGSMLAMHAAKLFDEFERIMLVTVYGSSARQVWEHPSLKRVRAKFEASNRGIDEAYETFGHLEAIHELERIGKRKILLFANERDPVIRYSNTKLLIDKAEELGLDITVKRIKARRHSLTILKVFRNHAVWVPYFMALKHVPPTAPHHKEFVVG